MKISKIEFVNYLLKFYGHGGLYVGPLELFRDPVTRDEAQRVATVLWSEETFEGDSFDRERARDLVISWRTA